MLNKILLIIIGVSVFGVLFFLNDKREIKKRLDFYLNKNNKKN